MKPTTTYDHFEALDIRVGRVLEVSEARTRKPTYRMTIDFGQAVGVKTSCAALRNYTPEELTGRQVIAVVNLPPLHMGPETSEVFVLGVPGADGATIRLAPETDVDLGVSVY